MSATPAAKGRGRSPRCHGRAMRRLYLRSGNAPPMASGLAKRFWGWGWVCQTCEKVERK